MADTEQRIDELTARLERLERRLELSPEEPAEPPDATAEGSTGPDAFWALAALRSRVAGNGGVLFTGAVTVPTGEHAEWQLGRTTDELLDSDWTEVADTVTALGHPIRLMLLQAVLAGSRTVTELAETEGLGTTGQLYHHLRPLVTAGWLRTRGRGRYEVPATRVVPLLAIIAAAQR